MNAQDRSSQRRMSWLIGAIVWGGALIVAAGISYFSRLNFWLCLVLVAVAWVINGVVAELEDRIPGGFFNPRRK
jgi:hypothetical protein